MTRVGGFDLAREIAEEKRLSYGISVTDGLYYIGTKEELDKLPVVITFSYDKQAMYDCPYCGKRHDGPTKLGDIPLSRYCN